MNKDTALLLFQTKDAKDVCFNLAIINTILPPKAILFPFPIRTLTHVPPPLYTRRHPVPCLASPSTTSASPPQKATSEPSLSSQPLQDAPNSHLSSFLQSPIVELIASNAETSKRFFMYSDPLGQRSTYMHEKLASLAAPTTSTDNAAKTVVLLCDPDHLSIYLYLLLPNILPTKHLDPTTAFNQLAGLYALATKLRDRKTKRITIPAMLALAREKNHATPPLPSASAITLVYAATDRNDPARRFFIDLVADRHHDAIPWLERSRKELPHTFLEGLLVGGLCEGVEGAGAG
ncbi:hypothetical protein K458DRAFT_464458 [Lentithecium fluviatile CBS 122367]|uniref:Uncharacterized protein n=1 Tax=Lentithecium fluviatile CBS 122367 TaxID=1168545 RepID=A0A6G1IHY9_9PLEO|nr:hypothetical protein K458DRAFT_464458 [Lentithecium fluviatile CBS 122367]